MSIDKSFNIEEQKLAQKDPVKARLTLKLAAKAMFEESVRYWDDGEDGGNSNAFLHAYWAALLTKNISSEWAKLWTDAHEAMPGIVDLNGQMDLFNNRLGISEALQSDTLTNEDLANRVEHCIDSGEGRRIKSGQLVPTTKSSKRELNIFEVILQRALSLLSKLIAENKTKDKNLDGMTPLIFATSCEYIEALKLLTQYCELEARDNYGETAVFYASRLDSTAPLQILIEAGCEINVQDSSYGQTPLMKAVLIRNAEHAKILVNSGADVDLKDYSGNTAFDHAKREYLQEEFLFLKPIA